MRRDASDPTVFVASGPVPFERFVAAMPPGYRASAQSMRPLRLRCLDTFDWRLHHAGTVLEHWSGSRFGLLRWRDRDTLRCRAVHEIRRVPDFPRDLPHAYLRRSLAELCGLRALDAICEIRGRHAAAEVIDARDKTVARIEWFEPKLPDGPAGILTLEPVAGFAKAAGRIRAALARIEGLVDAGVDPFDLWARESARAPGRCAGVDSPAVDPATRADAACRKVFSKLTDAFIENEPGAIANRDTEFLHDYRVALRKARSVLGEMKAVFPAHTTHRFERVLGSLARRTGELRDLHVYLLDFDRYQELIGAPHRAALEPLRTHLVVREAEAHREVARWLRSKRYLAIRSGWQRFVSAPVPARTGARNAEREIAPFSANRIARAYRRTVSQGRAISEASPSSDLHRLRKSCKKLRYLLELFGEFHDERTVRSFIRMLKRLQDHLGRFQDLQVQQAALRRFEEEMAERGTLDPCAHDAIAVLVTALASSEQRVRHQFAKRFANYDTARSHALIRRLRGAWRP